MINLQEVFYYALVLSTLEIKKLELTVLDAFYMKKSIET